MWKWGTATQTGMQNQLQPSYGQLQQAYGSMTSAGASTTRLRCLAGKDEDDILVDWARQRMDEWVEQVNYRKMHAWTTATQMIKNTYSSTALEAYINQTSPFLKLMKKGLV